MLTYQHSYNTRNIFVGLLSALIFAVGCGGEKNVVGGKNTIVYEPAPQWVGQRPLNSSNYIGIGSCSKISQPLDYAAVAKKNALNDLATEISVRVQGNTFLNSLEVNKNFSEEFISTISTSTNEEIKDFEVAGIWENEKEYWIYYHLNKAEYQRQKMEKKMQALNAANDYYMKGLEAEKVANIPTAVDLYLRGLLEMKEYWSETNPFVNETGKEIFLDNEIYSSIQRACSGLVIELSSEKIVLSRENQFNISYSARVTYNGTPAKGVSVIYNYDKGRFSKPKELISDEKGLIAVPVSDIDPAVKQNNMELRINADVFAGNDLDIKITSPLLKNTKTEKKQVPIDFVLPSFYIASDEKNFGNQSAHSTLSSAMKKYLTTQGLRFVDSIDQADYSISISSNTTQGGMAQSFHVAYLEMSISVKEKVSSQTVYGESLNNIKGLQLNFDAAGIEAYKKGTEKIESSIGKALLEAIL
jgi:hypothetical protein